MTSISGLESIYKNNKLKTPTKKLAIKKKLLIHAWKTTGNVYIGNKVIINFIHKSNT